jgi:hypothetical protein
LEEIRKQLVVRPLFIRHERFDVENNSGAQFEQLTLLMRFDLMEVVTHDG